MSSTARHRLRRLCGHFATLRGAECVGASACAAEEDSRVPVALVLGAGAGIGQGVAMKFAREGFHVVVVRRGSGKDRLLTPEADSKGKLEAFAASIRGSGGCATALFADGTSPEEVAELMQTIEQTIGPLHFINYNIGAQVGDRSVDKTSYRVFELAWRLGTLGAFATAKEAAKYMVPRGRGTIIYTGSTASMRGRNQQHAHTAAMGGRRLLTQSLAAELGPKGIHIVHVNIDGLINSPETAGAFLNRATKSGDAFSQVVAKLQESEEIVEPGAVADTYFHIHKQPKGVWTQELDLKPWTTKAWFSNSESNATTITTKT